MWRHLAIATLLALPLAPTAAQTSYQLPTQGVEVTDLGQGLYSFRHLGTRNIFIVTDDGVIATDPISPVAAQLMRAEIAKLTDQKVKLLIYSHQHWDHVLGGQVFKDEGAEIISHANCVKHFLARPHPDLVPPDRTVSGPETRIELGGKTLRLLYLGPNHGDCSLMMHLDGSDVLFAVDMATPGGMPLPNMPDYDLGEWIRTLREIEALGIPRINAGHGPAAYPIAGLVERRQYLEDLIAAVRAEKAKGTPSLQVADRIDLPRYRHFRNYETNLRWNVLRVLQYDEMGW